MCLQYGNMYWQTLRINKLETGELAFQLKQYRAIIHMNQNIQIIEKPEWVSWNDIHEVLVKAHAQNRANGINMKKPTLPGEKIAEEIGDEGKMFVALDGRRVVGTSAIVVKRKSYWCGGKQERYACIYFASVLPEYNGQGIFKKLDLKREKESLSMGIDKMLGDTHERNQHRLKIAQKAGYKFVDSNFRNTII